MEDEKRALVCHHGALRRCVHGHRHLCAEAEDPMWFWSGSTVKEGEIADVPAYNRACGRMWIAFSLPFWLSAFLGIWCSTAAAVLTVANCLIGIPVLVIVYHRIYTKYKA